MPRGIHPNSRKNLNPAKPGDIRNPEGINRKHPYSERLLHLGEELLSDTPTGEKVRLMLKLPLTARWADAAVLQTMMQAIKGNIVATREIIDRTEGKVVQGIEVSGLEGLADEIAEARKRAAAKEK